MTTPMDQITNEIILQRQSWIDTIYKHFGEVGLIGVGYNKAPLYNKQLPVTFKPTKQDLEYWLNNPGTAGFGFFLEASNLTVLDVDVPELYPLFQDIETYTTRTRGGGYHLYFKLTKPKEEPRDRITKYKGWDIDLLEKGRIDFGHGYMIIKEAPLLEVATLVPYLERLPKKPNIQDAAIEEFKRKINIEEILQYYSIDIKKSGHSRKICCPFHQDENPSALVNKDNIYCFVCDKVWDVIGIVQEKEGKDFKGAIKKLEEITNKKIEKPKDNNNPLPQADDDDIEKTVAIHLLKGEQADAILKTAEHLIQEHKLKTLLDTDEILYYIDGIYQLGGEGLAKEGIERIWQKKANNHHVSEILGHIKRKTYVKAEDFLEDLETICTQNGILNITTKEVGPHSPEHLTLSKIPVTYDPAAECPEIDRFLSNALHAEDLPTFYEIAGYCLYKSYKYHKTFLLIGGGGNGKTTAMNLIASFLGTENTTSIPLQTLELDRFAKAQLYGKLANVCDDLPNKAIYATGTFKQLTGNSPIDSDRKHKGRITFHNHAKLIFACNEMPEMQDNSDAFFDRWITINFPNKFRNTPNEDPNLLEKITHPQELSGFLNKALGGLERLITNKKFSTNKSTEENEILMTRLTNGIKAFADDCIVSDSTQWLPKEAIYAVYVKYCDYFKLSPKTNTKFTQEVKKYVHYEDCKRSIPGVAEQKHGWNGITFNWNLVNTLKISHLSYLSYFFAIVANSNKVSDNIRKNTDNSDNSDIPVKLFDFQEKPRDFKISVLDFLQNFDEGVGVERSELEILGSVDYQLTKEEIGLVLERLKSDGRIFEFSEGKYKINQ